MSVFLFHGDKGGTGKSLVASAFTDWMLASRGLSPLVVDADMRNADVARMFEGDTRVEKVNLRDKDGWIELTSLAAESKDVPMVVSLPGNIGAEVDERMATFAKALKTLNRDLYLFWVVTREPDSINLLKVGLKAYGGDVKRVVAVKNLHYGAAEKFFRWDRSKTRKEVLERHDGIEVEFPDLHDALVDGTKRSIPPVRYSNLDAIKDVYSGERDEETGKWTTPPSALRFGMKIEMEQWLKAVQALFDGLAPKIGLETPSKATAKASA